MNFIPESTPETCRDQSHHIITAKGTNHRRPCSPFSMVEATSSSNNGGGEGYSTSHGGCKLSCFKSSPSPKISSQEEEDMANCLIMLAQSVSPVTEDKSDLHCQKSEKLRNRRLSEMAATTAGGYECRTCNRIFSSFQALGGHRASHKKPKLTVEDRNSVSIKPETSEENQPKVFVDYEENKINSNSNKIPSPLPGFIQTGYKNSKGKVHECSICGLEFLSGQALGGHMRRHRPAPPLSNQIAVSTIIDGRSAHHVTEKSPVLLLDLNLPAPEFSDDVHSNFQFTASSSQQPHVFSAAALVDCHY